MSHGAFYTLGGYFTYIFVRLAGLQILAAFPLSILVSFTLGVMIEFTLIEKIKGAPMLPYVLTFGLAIVIEQILLLTFGGYYLTLPGFSGNISLGYISISRQRVFAGIVAVLLCVALALFLQKTKTGIATRMAVQNSELAMLVGINVTKIAMIMFGISCAFASVAGAVLAPEFSLYPTAGWEILFLTFAVVVVGGLGSIKGSFVASIIIGLIEAFTGYYISPALKTTSICIILILVLLIKPKGIFGKALEKV
jgi:branched-chain amino acid transport system permease protein